MRTSNLSAEYFGNVSTTFNKFQLSLLTMDYHSHPNPSKGSVAVTGNIIQFVIVLISLALSLVILKNRNKSNKGKDEKVCQKVRTVEDIPVHRYFSRTVPSLIEGLATVYQLKEEGVKVLDSWVRKYGSIFALEVVNEQVVCVQDPHLIQKILGSSNIHVLNKPRFLYDIFFTEWLRDGLTSSEVETWAAHKKILNRTVAYKSLPTYLKMMNKHSKNLVSTLRQSAGGLVEGEFLHDALYSHSIKIISEVVLGENSSSESESDDFHLHFKNWKQLVVYRFWNCWNLVPLIWRLNPIKKKFDYHVSKVAEHMDRDIEKCRKELENQKQKEKEDKDKTPLTDNDTGRVDGIKPSRSLIEEMISHNCSAKEIRDEVGTFLAAGHETTMVGIQFCLQHLAEHPEIQTRCQEELDALFDSKINETSSATEQTNMDYLTMEDLSKLKYLEKCILETLRITAVAPVFFRQLSAPMEIDEFKFKSGTTFCFMPWAIHRDSQNYPNPEKFDPDRFLPETVKKRNIYTYMPFSQGPRNCLGWKIAMMEMKVVLAWMLRQYDFHTTDRLEDVKIMFEITIFPERNFNVVLKKRKHVSCFRDSASSA